MKLTARLVFNPNNRLRADGTGQVVLYLYLGGRKRYIDTGFTCPPGKWNAKKGQIRGNTTANLALRAIMARVDAAYTTALATGTRPSLEALAQAATGNQPGQDFLQFMEQAIEDNTGISEGTRNNHRVALDWCRRYTPALAFSEITPAWVDGFQSWLLRQNKRLGSGQLSPNTVNRLMGYVRAYVLIAIRHGHIASNPFQGRKAPGQAKEHIWLTMEEVEAFADIQVSGNARVAQDMYLFGCYSGLRFSDIQALTPANLESREGKMWLKVTPRKTRKRGQIVEIPLEDMFWGRGGRDRRPLRPG